MTESASVGTVLLPVLHTQPPPADDMQQHHDPQFVSGNIEGDLLSSKQEDPLLEMGSISLNSVNAAVAKEWLVNRRQNVRPWAQFFTSNRFKAPNSVHQFSHRIVRNIDYFQSNYLCVFIGLIIFCLLTSPLLLIAIAASLGGCYIANLKQKERALQLMGREVPLSQQYAAIGILSIPVFWLAGAGSAVFWVLGASFLFIAVHAALFANEELNEAVFDLEEIQTV